MSSQFFLWYLQRVSKNGPLQLLTGHCTVYSKLDYMALWLLWSLSFVTFYVIDLLFTWYISKKIINKCDAQIILSFNWMTNIEQSPFVHYHSKRRVECSFPLKHSNSEDTVLWTSSLFMVNNKNTRKTKRKKKLKEKNSNWIPQFGDIVCSIEVRFQRVIIWTSCFAVIARETQFG